MFRTIFNLLVILLVVKLLWSIANYFLPKIGTEIIVTDKKEIVALNINRSFSNVKAVKKAPKKSSKKRSALEGVVLKAIYLEESSGSGFVTIEDKSASYFLSKGEKYKGYKLIEIGESEAVFQDGSGEYTLSMDNAMKSIDELMDIVEETPPTSSVSREEIIEYSKNIENIWKNITIVEVIKDKKVHGYKVININEESIFFKELGIRKDDIIQSIDGKVIQSYKDALEAYKKIKTIESLRLGVLRGGNMMELYYEIY
jgi:type II secretion system protein C